MKDLKEFVLRDVRFEHGDAILFKSVHSTKIENGRISINDTEKDACHSPISDGMRVFICQDKHDGTRANERFEYKYSWTIGCVHKITLAYNEIDWIKHAESYEIY